MSNLRVRALSSIFLNIRVDGLTFRGNKVVQNEDFPAFHSNKTRFRLLRAKNVVIENNEFSDGDASVSEE